MFPKRGPAAARCAQCGALNAIRDGVSVQVGDVRQPAGSAMRTHEHDTARLVVTTRGRYDERWRSRTVDCRAGTAFFRPAGEPHAESFAYEAVAHVTVILPATVIERFTGGDRRFAGGFAARDAGISALAERCAAEVWSPDSAAPIVLEGLALELFAQLRLHGRTRVERAPRWIAAARAMIEAQPDSVTPGALARELHLDASYAARAFRAHLGRTFGDYIRDARIARSVRRLASDPDATVADVALEAGFYDQSHFARAFKRVVGVTPRRYRELDRGEQRTLRKSKSS